MVGNTPPASINNLILGVVKSGRAVFMDSVPSVNSSDGRAYESSIQSEDERPGPFDTTHIPWDGYCANLSNGRTAEYTSLHMSSEATHCIHRSILPITSPNHRRVGALVVEQPGPPHNQQIWKQDLRFYEEVAARLGYACTLVNVRKWLIRAVMSAFHWFGQYLEEGERVTFYYLLNRSKAEGKKAAADVPSENNQVIANHGEVLLRLVTKTSNETVVFHSNPELMTRTGDYIRSHLFEAVEYAGPVERKVLGEHHLTLPLMNIGQVLGVVDVQTLNRKEGRAKNQTQVLTMMNILTMLYNKTARDAGLVPTIPCVHGTEYNERNRLTVIKPESVFENMLKSEMKYLANELDSKFVQRRKRNCLAIPK
ncbi:unnamed protein product [Dicrocoelium dendriticum]|nr:unnamed protein product [Dicrocoelium dendriticum]